LGGLFNISTLACSSRWGGGVVPAPSALFFKKLSVG